MNRAFAAKRLSLAFLATSCGLLLPACGDDGSPGAMMDVTDTDGIDDTGLGESSGSEESSGGGEGDGSGSEGSGGPETIGEPFSLDDPFEPQNHFAHRIIIELPDGTTIYDTRDTAELQSRFNASADGGSQAELRAAVLSMEFEATVEGTVDHDRVWTVGILAAREFVSLPGELDFVAGGDGFSDPVVRLKEESESLGGQFFVESEGTAATGTMTLTNCPTDVIDHPKIPMDPATDANRLFGSFRDLEIEGPDGIIATISGDFAIGVLELDGDWC